MFLRHALLDNPNISYGFFGRKGGVSQGVYKGLNCGRGSGDDLDAVNENRRRVCEALGTRELLTLWQEHTSTCLTVTEIWDKPPIADAMVTTMRGVALGALSADCGPVLFYGDGVIGAAHAGWRGAVGGVLENTVSAMRALGARDIKAVIGPCIGPQSYDVSPGFEAPFLEQDSANEAFFCDGRFDLWGYIGRRLDLAGVEAAILGRDTYAEEGEYFSYRRNTQQGIGAYGRQVAAIMLKD